MEYLRARDLLPLHNVLNVFDIYVYLYRFLDIHFMFWTIIQYDFFLLKLFKLWLSFTVGYILFILFQRPSGFIWAICGSYSLVIFSLYSGSHFVLFPGLVIFFCCCIQDTVMVVFQKLSLIIFLKNKNCCLNSSYFWMIVKLVDSVLCFVWEDLFQFCS